MAYEYLSKSEVTWEEAPRIMGVLTEKGFKPIAVRVDPVRKATVVYFAEPLKKDEKEKLDEVMKKEGYVVL